MMAEQGLCIWLTGLSGAGKSTIALALKQRLETLGLQAILFDGDAVRSRLATPLGFTRQDRNANVSAVAYEAAKFVRASGIAICALMSPFEEGRRQARLLFGPDQFVLVYVATPLAVCEERDPKGLYAKARRSEIRHVIGIDEKYEVPRDADMRLDTTGSCLDADVESILEMLVRRRKLVSAVPA